MTPNGFAYVFIKLRAQHALTIYTLLPVLIMTSTLVTVYFASCGGILLGATFFIWILEVFYTL